MVACLRCREEFPENQTKTFDGKTYCLDCYPKRVKTCCECGHEFLRRNGRKHDNKWYCDDCFHEHFVICYDCEDVIPQDDSFYAEERHWCESCYCERFGSCQHCGETFRNDALHTAPDGDNQYCNECFSERFFVCEHCGESFNLDDACGEDNDVCPGCDTARSNKVIHDYGYRPEAEFKKLKWDDELFMGVELEVQYIAELEGETSKAEVINKAKKLKEFLTKEKLDDNFYFKYDASVSSGFEIVTHPFTLQYGHKNMKWYKVMNWLKGNKISSQETGKCGLHVHINRKMFTDLDISKLRLFFSRNQDKIYKFSKREGGRSGDPLHYCKFEEWNIQKFIRNQEVEGRYWALNLNSTRETIEIRVFRGTLNHARFLASLQFCHAVSHFVKIHGITSFIYGEKTYENNSWKLFTDWCKEKTEYNHLATYLKKEQLCV